MTTSTTTIRYWSQHSQQCRYLTFQSYKKAINAIKKLNLRAELV